LPLLGVPHDLIWAVRAVQRRCARRAGGRSDCRM